MTATTADTRTLIIGTSLGIQKERRSASGVRGLARGGGEREDQLTGARGRYRLAQELQELRREERVAAEVVQPEGCALPHRDVRESHVEELLQEHWRRQCAGQSTGKRGRTLEHVFRQRLLQHEIG